MGVLRTSSSSALTWSSALLYPSFPSFPKYRYEAFCRGLLFTFYGQIWLIYLSLYSTSHFNILNIRHCESWNSRSRNWIWVRWRTRIQFCVRKQCSKTGLGTWESPTSFLSGVGGGGREQKTLPLAPLWVEPLAPPTEHLEPGILVRTYRAIMFMFQILLSQGRGSGMDVRLGSASPDHPY